MNIMKLIKDNGLEFKTRFHTTLSNFICPFTGFDIVKFDTWIETPDGISTKDWIIKNYGIEASELITKLING